MFESIEIQSHIGPYQAQFVDDGPAHAAGLVGPDVHFIIDRHVADLYANRLQPALTSPSVLLLEASEKTKSLEQFPTYIEHLVRHSIQRRHRLVAIGGGTIQDTVCFLAATVMRGVEWSFYPTTLLAQADSCIGSKSSINVGNAKNIMGTFTPPREVFIDVNFLTTLDERDVRSGVGEILKVHAIAGPQSFAKLAEDYPRIFADKAVMAAYIQSALNIKKPYIELDEFDRRERQIFNYGHSFGHAIESATDFSIPHGIAVTMGMDIANFVSWKVTSQSRTTFDAMHPVLRRNYRDYEQMPVPLDRFMAALGRDKKNVNANEVSVILPNADGRLVKLSRPADAAFVSSCVDYFRFVRTSASL